MIRLQGKLYRVPFARKILVVGKMVSIWFKLGGYCVISIKYAKRSRYLFHAVASEKATWNSIFRVENVQLYQTILHCNAISLLFMKGHSETAKMWSLHMKFTELSFLTGLVKTISSLVKLWAGYVFSVFLSLYLASFPSSKGMYLVEIFPASLNVLLIRVCYLKVNFRSCFSGKRHSFPSRAFLLVGHCWLRWEV